MAEAIRNAVAEHPAEAGERQEYWKPIDVQRNAALPSDACMTCGTEYPIGARYCYVCGSDRSTGADEPRPSRLKMGFTRALDLDVLVDDPRVADAMAELTVVDPTVNLSAPAESARGRYWFNLHLVLVVAEHARIGAGGRV